MLKKKANWSQKNIFEYTYDPNRATWLHASIPLSHRHNIGRNHGYRTGVITLHRITTLFLVRFPTEPYADESSKTPAKTHEGFPNEVFDIRYNGHSPEDWIRVYWVLKAAVRKHT